MPTVPTKPAPETHLRLQTPPAGDARKGAGPDDATRNTLVRAALKARARRFTGEPITAFGELA